MTRISYKKTFLTGTLKGLTVDAGFTCPKDRVAHYVGNLERMDVALRAGQDAVTGSKFLVSQIEVQ